MPETKPLDDLLTDMRRQRSSLAVIVDEFGRTVGIVTIEDIIEEIVGDFTTSTPGTDSYRREADGSIAVDGTVPLRALNRKLGTHFPLDGPKTLNGLIVAQLGEIPDAGTRVRVADQAMEILQTQDRGIKVVRLLAPIGRSVVARPH